jgi:hypothetical protein
MTMNRPYRLLVLAAGDVTAEPAEPSMTMNRPYRLLVLAAGDVAAEPTEPSMTMTRPCCRTRCSKTPRRYVWEKPRR